MTTRESKQMKSKMLSSLIIPMLFAFTGIISYYTIKNEWNYEIASYSIFLITLIYIFILERVIPLKQEWKSNKRNLWTDIKHLLFSVAIFDALGKMIALSLVIYLQDRFFLEVKLWHTMPFFIVFILANLIGELLPYLYHRMSHIGSKNSFISLFLWKIHALHHLPTSLNWFKTNWIHPVNMFLNSLLKMTPILLLGFSSEIIFLVGVTHIVIAYISHANIQTHKSFWDYLVVTPQIHHFHHSKKLEEARNFGNSFPFWDLIFGTYYNRDGAVDQVGVIEDSDMQYPKDSAYLKQLLFPFMLKGKCCH